MQLITAVESDQGILCGQYTFPYTYVGRCCPLTYLCNENVKVQTELPLLLKNTKTVVE